LCDNKVADNLELYYSHDEKKYNFDSMFSNLKPLLNDSDFVSANLETPISYDNKDLTNEQYIFNSPYEFAAALKKAGVDYVSTANNHCLDRGVLGLDSTIKSLDEIGLLHSGTHTTERMYEPLIVTVKGVRLALLAYTYGTNAVCNRQYLGYKNRKLVDLIQEQEESMDRIDPWKWYIKKKPNGMSAKIRNYIDSKLRPENVGKIWVEKTTYGLYRKCLMKNNLNYIKRRADFSIVNLHIGGQYNKKPNYYTKKTVNWLMKKRVNLIIANHEHVVHGIENRINKNQFSTYAIGDCLSSTGITVEPFDRFCEYSICVHIYIDSEQKKIVKASFSVLKTIVNNGKYETWPAYDLLQKSTEEKNRNKEELLSVAKLFSGREYFDLKREFEL